MRTRITVKALSVFFLWVGTFSLTGTVVADDSYQPVYLPTLEIAKTSGQITIDGHLDDPGWRGAGRAGNFAEHRPGDQTQPPVDTEALITYDDDNLYVAFICYDDPRTIRASFCDRDRIFNDDNIVLLIDTYGDAAWAYEIMANPYGIQGDLLWSKNGGEDEKYDMIYHSAGKITAEGYQIELAVPFSSMRFPNKEKQTWKVDFWRNHPRESRRQYSWAAIDRDDPCWACQWGTIIGIENVVPGRGIEFLPAIIGYQSGALVDAEDPQSAFDNEDPDGELSLGAKYTISSNMTAEAAINPDFSQVEADVAQIDVNTTFALFYPERRPFFQEGSDLFNTYFTTFYSRLINDPQFAAKLIGRLDRTSVAYLAAYDEHTPIILPFEESSEILQTGKSAVNILRARRTFGEESHIGMIVTDRRLDGGGSGTLMSADGMVELAKNYRFEWQLIGTHTEEPEDTVLTAEMTMADFDDHTAAFDGESFWGHGVYASLERESRYWDFDVNYWERSPTFRADIGYEPSNNNRQVEFSTMYFFYPNGKIVENFYPMLWGSRVWNFDGTKKEESIQLSLEMQLTAQTGIHPAYTRGAELYQGIYFDDIWYIHWCTHSRFSDMLTADFAVNYGHQIARRENPPVMSAQTGYYLGFNIKPVDRLLIQPSFDYARAEHLDTGEELYEGYITRTRVNLQITRELAARLIVQYDDFSKTWQVDPLLTYRINPFSAFYIGSTYDYNDLKAGEGDGHEQWKLSSRQFFLKLQYLFQL